MERETDGRREKRQAEEEKVLTMEQEDTLAEFIAEVNLLSVSLHLHKIAEGLYFHCNLSLCV